MKKPLTLLIKSLIILLGFNSISAQCTRTAPFQNGNYVVTGTATMEFLTNGTKTLSFAGFSTMTGPDVDVYLSNSNNSNTGAVFLADVNYSATSQYTIPANININDYQYVLLWCTNFSQWWGFGTLSIANGADCNALSIEEGSINNISIYPNPTSDKVKISGLKNDSAEVRIFNTLGETVYQSNRHIDQDINVSNLNSGIYILSLSVEGRKTSRKLIIQ